jgi:hypothetical protein
VFDVEEWPTRPNAHAARFPDAAHSARVKRAVELELLRARFFGMKL